MAATVYFFDKAGNKIADSIAEASGVLTLVRGDVVGGDRVVFTENGTTTVHLGRIDAKSFIMDRTVTTSRIARGVGVQRGFGSNIIDPATQIGQFAYITTRANS